VNGLKVTGNKSFVEGADESADPVVLTEHCKDVVIRGNDPGIVNNKK
jgi:hypothetical protein